MAPDTPEQTDNQTEQETLQVNLQQAAEAAQLAQNAAAQAHREAVEAHAAAQTAAASQQSMAFQAGTKRPQWFENSTSAAAYRSDLDSITQYLTWDEQALKSYYYDGCQGCSRLDSGSSYRFQGLSGPDYQN